MAGKEGSRANWSYVSKTYSSTLALKILYEHIISGIVAAVNGVRLDEAFGETFPRTFKAFIRCSSFPTK
jgi:hypothetical protein